MEKKKIKLKPFTPFLKCSECFVICYNDDDNVCLACGSKQTKWILADSRIFKKVKEYLLDT